MTEFVESAFVTILIVISIAVLFAGAVELLERYIPDKVSDWLIDHIFLGKK